MKRSTLIFSALCLIGLSVGVPLTHAANQFTSSSGTITAPSSLSSYTSNLEAPTSYNSTQNSDGSYTISAQGSQSIPVSVNPSSAPDNPTSIHTFTTDTSTYGYIMSEIMGLFAWLLGVAALTLDYATYYTVVHAGAFLGNHNANGISAIGVVWQIFRDIGNIVLIFGFLAVGIEVMLGVQSYGGKKMIPILLIAAVFLNFSLFISEAVIDVGNLFATEFYAQINGGQVLTPQQIMNQSHKSITTAIHEEGISNRIMQQLGLAAIYGGALDQKYSTGSQGQSILNPNSAWYIGFLGILLFLIAAFVMFSLAFILIARFVILILLIIVAPVGFAGLAVPKLSKTASAWWSKLFEQTITAPVLLLLLYVALAVITDANFLAGFGVNTSGQSISGLWDGFLTGDLSGFASLVLSFLVAMGLLLVVTIASKRLSAFGAGWAIKMGGAASFGLTAATMRQTVGRGLTVANRRWRNSRLARVPVLGRSVGGALEKGVKSSFDFRATGAFKSIGVDAGKAQKGGYYESEKKAIKAHEAYAKTLGMTAREKAEKEEWDEREKEQKKVHTTELANMDAAHAAERQSYEKERKQQLARIAELRARAQQTRTEKDKQELAEAELTLKNQNDFLSEMRERQQTQRKALEGLQKETLDNIKAATAEIERRPQMQYAKELTWGPGVIMHANRKSAENIVKSAKKSKSEKDSDKLFEMLEKATKKEEAGSSGGDKAGGGGGSH